MTMTALTIPAPRTDPLMLAGRLRPTIERHRADAEVERRLPTPLLDALRAEGAFRLFTPAELGGFELGLGTVVHILEDLARLDGSVAWNVWNGNLTFVAALLDDAGIDAVWSDNTDPIIANSARVTGTAAPVDGGYRLSGRWDLVSAIDSADWVAVFAIVVAPDGPRLVGPDTPDVRVFFARLDDVTVLDTWQTNGMRGTGSNTVVAEEVFVPEFLAPSPMTPPRIDRAPYRIPAFTLASTGSAGVLLGLARAAIDAIVDLAGGKATDNGSTLAHRSHAQAAIGAADAALRAARAGLYDALDHIDAAAERGEAITPELRGPLRASMVLCADTARDVAVAMYRLGSSTSVYAGNRIEQVFRDVHVAAQHGLLTGTVSEINGRLLLGLDAGTPLF